MAKPLLTGGNGKSNEFVGTAAGQVPLWDGTSEWVAGLPPYDFIGRFVGTPAANAVIAGWAVARDFTFTASATAAYQCAALPDTNVVEMYLQKNGVTFLTITFPITGTALPNGLFNNSGTSGSSTQTFTYGDLFTIKMGPTVNASFSTPYYNVPCKA